MADENSDLDRPERKPEARPRHRILFSIRGLLRTRIVAGLLTVIPIWVTWVVVKFVFDMMKSATMPIAWKVTQMIQEGHGPPVPPADAQLERTLISRAVSQIIEHSSQGLAGSVQEQEVIDRIAAKLAYTLDRISDAPVGVFSEVHLRWIVPLLAVLLTLCFLYLLGLLTASVFGRRLIILIEHLFERLPLVKTVYRSTKQVVMTLGGGGSMSFRRVVLVEFPRPGTKCVGFLTSVMKDRNTGRQLASVFIATTPTCTTGYVQIFPLEEVSETDWTVEAAIKMVMSGGVLSPPSVSFDKICPVHWPPPRPADTGGKRATEA